jgi:UDP-N-acetylmuramate dehydrogenase
MSIFSGLENIVKPDYALAPLTWYGLGGAADYFITPQTVDELKKVVQRCRENNIPMHVLGFGSNLLVSDEGVRGAVIKLSGDELTASKFDGECLTVWGGADLSKLVLACVKKGLSGLEGVAGIPGSVGGAVRMNAGGNFGDIGASVDSVVLMDSEGEVFERQKPDLEFQYRWTNITAKFILAAKIKLAPAEPDQILRTIKEIWIYKKNSQPLNTKNAGCVFKNPRGLSAGALIDRAGLKGKQIGGAQVSEKHANFFVAHQGCTSADILKLINLVRQTVNEQFDIKLELELEIW